jgi:uncharacterized protein
MEDMLFRPCTAFEGNKRLVAGPLVEVALAVKNQTDSGARIPILVFDDATAHTVGLDLRGSKQEILGRLPEAIARLQQPEPPEAEPERSGRRGRPKLGVVGREITLLPRHWQWLDAQPGGASVALRKLVDQARRTSGDRDRRRAATEAAYRFVTAMAGDRPGYEDATRALFAGDLKAFGERIATWPADIRDYAIQLAFAADANPAPAPA